MEIKKYRLLSEGQLPDSDGGVFNPGCVAHDSWVREFLVRVEKHTMYHHDSGVSLIVEKIDKMRAGEIDNIYPLTKIGYPPKSKIEDFRPFKWKGQLYAIHTICISEGGWEIASVIKPVISRVTRTSIELVDWVDLPYVPRKIGEKNWLPIVYKDDLYLLYGLDPLRIFKLEGWSWREVKFEETGLAKHVKLTLPNSSFLSLSAITHYEGSNYLGFWHIRDTSEDSSGIYKQGMFILNMETMRIEHFTPPVLQGGGLKGNKPSCLYVSSLVATPTLVEVYAGEADSHSCLIEISREEINKELMAYPWKNISPLRVLFRDFGVGDFICMAYALNGWMEQNNRGVKIYVHNNLQLASALKITGVTVCRWNGEPVDIDLSSNEDSLPEDQRFTYAEKISGSLKGWYARKLGSTPAKLDVSHIEPNTQDAIVLFPFAAYETRCWDLKNWIQLTEELIEEGHRVIISDPFPARCKNLPGEHQCGTSMIDVLRLLKGCKMVIANESGGAHLAGLFTTPTLVLSGWLDPSKVYDYTNNQWIYKRPLSSITVEEVKEKIKEMLG